MEQRKGKRQLNQGVRVKRTEEKEKRADRSVERTREATAVRAKRTTESRAARGAEMSLGQKLKAIHGKVRKAVHESRERNFPESNGVAGQLLLLLCGLAAYWGALGREKLRLARRSHIRRTGGTSRAAKWRRKKYYPLAFGGAALVIAATAVFVSRYTFGTTVIYEGQALDTVASELEAKRVTASIADITSETLGKTFTFSDSSIQYTSGLVERSAVVDRAELEEELTDEMGLVTQGYSLYINDELIGSTQYEGALEGLLDQLKESYISEDTLTVDFVEDVRIAKGYVPTESIMNLGQIAEILNSTKEGEVTYTVVKGDTWSGIANSHGMTTKELLAINPDFDINRLQIGDELTLSNAVPYLTVMVTERQNYVEDIQYDITYTDDATMYKGDYKVLSKGVYGTADVVADVTYVNGEETERTVISSVTLTEPVTEQRAQGTKARPSWYPTGSFRWPTSGRITSYFGYRNTGIRGASTNHRGIDISVSYGTPIYAADGEIYRVGDWQQEFTIQSISKTITLILALQLAGYRKVFSKVGVEPTGDPFNSIVRLETTAPRPLNPMINAGAIATASCCMGGRDAFSEFLKLTRRLCGRSSISLNEEVYRSEKQAGMRNRSMAYLMQSDNLLECDAEDALDLYFRMCSVNVNTMDLARYGMVLAGNGKDPETGEQLVEGWIVRIVKTLMVTCGLYDASGEFAMKVGIPAKSGVGGGIMGSVERKMGVAAFSPGLDAKGNSVGAFHMLEYLSHHLGLHYFAGSECRV